LNVTGGSKTEVPVPYFVPQIIHGLASNQTQALLVRGGIVILIELFQFPKWRSVNIVQISDKLLVLTLQRGGI